MTNGVNHETLWNALPQPAVAVDQDGKIVAFNAAAEQFFSVSARSIRALDCGIRPRGVEACKFDRTSETR